MKRKKIICLQIAGMLLVLSGAGFSEKDCFCKQYLKKRINCYGGGIGI